MIVIDINERHETNVSVPQDEYSILNSKHFIGIHGYVLVYSVASTSSFEMVQVIRDKILNHLVRSPLQLLPTFFQRLYPASQAPSILASQISKLIQSDSRAPNGSPL